MLHTAKDFEINRDLFPEASTATHSSILPWRIPWTEEPGGYVLWGRKRVGHN